MLVTLLTDFGTEDTFVGVMKGVIKTVAPSVDVIDLTHHVPPQDIPAGAFALKTAYPYFPPGTVHVAVVDPGVGSGRRPIAAHIGAFFYVCPDNGLLSYVLAENTCHQAVVLDQTPFHRPHVSRTFHGRDIFARVAAHLAQGVPLEALGTPFLETLTTFPLSQPDVLPDVIVSHVISSDVFGNVFLDLTEDVYHTWQRQKVQISVQGHDIAGPCASYSDVSPGTPLALFGSSGHLEIAVRNGNAREMLGLRLSDSVIVRRDQE